LLINIKRSNIVDRQATHKLCEFLGS
jgi:hypothetical protein